MSMQMTDSLAQDVRMAVRVLGKSPGTTALCILSIALGIGLTTGLFSVGDAMLLRPLPLERPGDIYEVVSRADDGQKVFYEGKCQWKYLPAELKRGETSCWHSAPCCAAVPVRCDVTSQPRWSVMPAGLSDFLLCSSVVADHREAVDNCWFLLSGFPS
jgi:hypothetical protein